MIQSATFSMEQSQNILKIFLVDYDMTKVIQKFVKRQPIHLREHLKRIIRQTIINIQAHLFRAQKIPFLLLYDNQSDQMFEAFLNLKAIIPDSQKDNFYLNFVNMKSEGCRIMRFGRTDYHVSINSEQREKIYARFIHYARQNNLHKYAVLKKDEQTQYDNPPYGDPSKLFSLRDLQFIFKTFCQYKGDIVKMVQHFKYKGVEDPKFQLQSLQTSLPNLMLIGYYNAHKIISQLHGTEPIRWSQFREKYPLPEQIDFKAKIVWLRIAIRNDADKSQLNWIHKIQKKRIITKTQKALPQKRGPVIQHKKWRKGRDQVVSKIKQQIKTTLIDNKTDMYSVDGSLKSSSYRSQHNQLSARKQRSQKHSQMMIQKKQQINQPNQEFYPDEEDEEDSYQQQNLSKMQRDPQFLKRIQKLSQSQMINQEKDQKDVVWEQIPQKISSIQPQNQSSANNPSQKFYSQKFALSKPSKQSLRSQKQGKGKPKAIQIKKKIAKGEKSNKSKSKSRNGQLSGQQSSNSEEGVEQNYGEGDYDPEASNSYSQQKQGDNQYQSD